MFEPHTPLLEIVVRVLLVYLLMLVLVRLMGKKEIARLSPLEFLVMLLLARTAGPAMTNSDTSLSVAAVAATTLAALTIAMDRLVFRSRRLERLVEGTARQLIRDGKILQSAVEAEHLTAQQLVSALRSKNLAGPDEVAEAYLEPGGKISVIPKDR